VSEESDVKLENCVHCGTKIEVYEDEGHVLCPKYGRYRPQDQTRTGLRGIDSRVYELYPLVSVGTMITLMVSIMSPWILTSLLF
jgi:predicted RNA-binding Zn-ribbon protein involved in translation (DUF1610 family)